MYICETNYYTEPEVNRGAQCFLLVVICEVVEFRVSDGDGTALVVRGNVGMDALYVTALSYTQLGLQVRGVFDAVLC